MNTSPSPPRMAKGMPVGHKRQPSKCREILCSRKLGGIQLARKTSTARSDTVADCHRIKEIKSCPSDRVSVISFLEVSEANS